MRQEMSIARRGVLLVTAALFGSSFFLVKLTVAAGRAGLADIVVCGVLKLRGGSFPAPGAAWLPLSLLGLLTAVIQGVAVFGEALSPSAIAGFGLIILGAASITGNLRTWKRRPAWP